MAAITTIAAVATAAAAVAGVGLSATQKGPSFNADPGAAPAPEAREDTGASVKLKNDSRNTRVSGSRRSGGTSARGGTGLGFGSRSRGIGGF